MSDIVVIPTYNEKENISNIVPQIMAINSEVQVLVVDDNSPDGTADVVRNLQGPYASRLHLEVRTKKDGLGRAYIHGFKWAIARGYSRVCQMDADFSHRIVDLNAMLKKEGDHDLLIGSRWVKGGGTINWSWLRKLISRGGSLYSRLILGKPIKDFTGGFNLWRVDVLKNINLDSIRSEGYSFQIEMKYRAVKKGFNVVEHPIVFEERRAGQSKMSMKIVLEALYRVWSIKLSN